MSLCKFGRIKCFSDLAGSRHFSRSSRKTKSITGTLTNDEIDAKIRELQLLKSQNLQRPESPGFVKMIREGFGYGIGISLAQRVIGSIFGLISPGSDSHIDSHIDSNSSEMFPGSNNQDEGWSWSSDELLDDE
ncbi:hypothetical protein TpMuguga_03g00653 [Theileria parva strain Muguga]|uniref:Uncharacterized protein n=1 Tax=Theileria parva TaxID=5875 RepID=Q4MZ38_THEPA|nr:uncharacterized protein TpMuguga_03g00653 [Theileria parva strain Muguga]EAN30494.1 hypothetical protein TpMuguga_03g00653 [Theileria parva strain Muguga]|eukprot:XP_762777.1 hypothetical protein [Theileria parva strain Muguga]